MDDDAFFAAAGDGYMPLAPSRGYWKRDSLHGRSIVGLLGYEIDRRHGSTGHIPTRLNVDMYKLAPFARATIITRIVKDSSRLRLVEAELIVAGEATARATCQFLRSGETPPGTVWSPGPWQAPHPEQLEPLPEGKHPRIFEMRDIAGRLGEVAPKRIWTRERHSLVQGVPLTPYARVVLAADFASPYAHAGDAGIRYINTDVTIHIHRLPGDEWIGFEATGHEASGGIAVGHCRIHDLHGALGYVSCTALANERRRAL